MKLETEIKNNSYPNIPTGNISERNELIYTGRKIVDDRISVPLTNPKRNTKPGWKIRLEAKSKKLQQQAKVLKKRNTQENVGIKRPKQNS